MSNCGDCGDCDYCANYYDCVNCVDCVDCEYCNNCTDCINCNTCEDCTNCTDCNECDNCVDCVDCIDCAGITGGVGLRGHMGNKAEAIYRLNNSVSDTPYEGGTWESREKTVNGVLGVVDFECNFDDCGKCAAYRADEEKTGNWDRACCSSCARFVGYLDRIPKEALDPLIEGFDPEVGFWTPKGCSIPPKWRSKICLAHSCAWANESATITVMDALKGLRKTQPDKVMA